MKRVALLAIIAGALGCQGRTELMVGIVTDLSAPDSMNHVTLEVFRAEDDILLLGQEWDLSGTPSEVFNLPGSYGLVADDGAPTVKLLLKGTGANFERLERRATVGLVEGETLFMRMSLVGNCTDRLDCAEGQTCIEGVCRSPLVNAKQLPSFSDSLLYTLTCDSGVRYIDTATSMPLPLSDDAQDCPPDLCRDGVCLDPLPAASDHSPPRTVSGTAINFYLRPGASTGQSDVIDISAVAIEALVPVAGGGVRVFPGVGTATGTFTIPDVPEGEYILHFDRRYYVTTGSEWDFGATRQYRPNLVPANAGTTISLTATNLTPWQTTDQLRFSVPTARGYFQASTVPAMNDTMVSNSVLQVSTMSGFLMAMDPFEVHQLTQRQVGSVQYYAIDRRYSNPGITLNAGSSVGITAPMQPLPQDQMLSGVYVASAWDTALGFTGTNFTAVNPRATERVAPRVLITSARDGDADSIHQAVRAHLFDASFGHGADVDLGSLPYAKINDDPQFIEVTNYVQILVRHPLATSDNVVFGPAGFVMKASEVDGQIHPRMSPVRDLLVDGKAAFTTGQTMSQTPTLTWTRPALGTPSQYQIQVYRISLNGTATMSDQVAFVFTPNTQITLPPGIIVPGDHYVFYVNATSGTVNGSPFRSRLPQAFAPTISEVFAAQ